MPTILLTRPAPDATASAAVLQRCGFQTLLAPVLEIKAAQQPAPPLADIQALIVTSTNTARSLQERDDVADLLQLPCFVVGEKTAIALREIGFTKLHIGTGDGAALANLIKQQCQHDAGTLLHIHGHTTATEPQASLQVAGFKLRDWVVYEAVPASALPPAIIADLRAKSVHAVLFYSPRSAAVFADLITRAKLQRLCETMVAVVISSATGQTASILPWRKLVTASAPNQAAMVTALRNQYSNEDHVIEPTKTETAAASSNATTATKTADRGGNAGIAWLALLLALGGITAPWWQNFVPGFFAANNTSNQIDQIKSETEKLLHDKLAQLPQPDASLPERLTALQQQLDTAKATMPKDVSGDITTLQNAVLELKAALDKTAAQLSVSQGQGERSLIIRYLQLREAAGAAAPFTAALQDFCTTAAVLAGTKTICDNLQNPAASGAATTAMLQSRFAMMAPTALQAARAAHAETWWERIGVTLQSIIAIRKTTDNATGYDRVIHDIEAALQRNDTATAVTAANTLPDNAKIELKEWLIDAEQRLAVNNALQQLGEILSKPDAVTDTAPVTGTAP